MAGKSKSKKAEFRASVSPVRSQDLVEQVVIPDAWDVLSDLINIAEKNGDEDLRRFAERMMSRTWGSQVDVKEKGFPAHHSKVQYIKDFLEKRFQTKLKGKGKSTDYGEHLDLMQDALEKLLTEETQGKDITQVETESEVNEKLRLVISSVLGDALRDQDQYLVGGLLVKGTGTSQMSSEEVTEDLAEPIALVPGPENFMRSPSAFMSGEGNQKAIDQYINSQKKAKRKDKQAAKDASSPVRNLTSDQIPNRKVELTEEKAQQFLDQKEKEKARKEKSKLKSYSK